MTRVVVVGGLSRSALAFRRLAATRAEYEVTVLVRRRTDALAGERIVVVANYFDPPVDCVTRADAIINFVGIPDNRPALELQQVNVLGPERLAKCARASGAKHFIHISSLHVYGDQERVDRFTLEAPLSAYARSKLAADQALAALASPDFRISLLRMPMHYGPDVGDKLRRLAKLTMSIGWFPIPTKPLRRSMVHVDNLAAAILEEIRVGSGGIVFVADDDLFGYEVLRDAIKEHTGRDLKLVRLPTLAFAPLRILARGVYRRLYRDNAIAPSLVLQPKGGYPVHMRAGLRDVLKG
jgi:UDP-glucose 4-epimerase